MQHKWNSKLTSLVPCYHQYILACQWYIIWLWFQNSGSISNFQWCGCFYICWCACMSHSDKLHWNADSSCRHHSNATQTAYCICWPNFSRHSRSVVLKCSPWNWISAQGRRQLRPFVSHPSRQVIPAICWNWHGPEAQSLPLRAALLKSATQEPNLSCFVATAVEMRSQAIKTLLTATPLGLAPISFQNCLRALSMCRRRLTAQTLSMPILKRSCRGKHRRPRRWTQGRHLCHGRRGRSSRGHRDIWVLSIAVRHLSSSHGTQLFAAMRRRIICTGLG